MNKEQLIKKIRSAYNSNKEALVKVRQEISRYGMTSDGLTDENESFEQGYNNALEYVLNLIEEEE